MRRYIFILTTLLVSMLPANAQILIEDINKDGVVDVVDISELVDSMLRGKTTVDASKVTDVANVVLGIKEADSIYVDLGLSVKWARMNLGALSPEDMGQYYSWGETTGYGSDKSDGNYISWANYSLCEGTSKTIKRYCTTEEYGTVDGITQLSADDDAATKALGTDWHIPTDAEFTELRENCTWTWTKKGTTYGYEVEGPNGNTIFLPAAGCRYYSDLANKNREGYYWTSTLFQNSSDLAIYVNFYSSSIKHLNNYRYMAFSIRPVCK